MSTFWAALIAAGAAIVASALTSYLTHWYSQRRTRTDYELKWLEERFVPALNFLGRVSAIISNSSGTKQEERRRIANQIKDVVVGQSKEDNAWCIAVLLDPEDTGLSDLIHSAMTYAHIADSQEEFTHYWVRLQSNLKELAEEFRRERTAIAAGDSLEGLIKARKRGIEKRVHSMTQALSALRAVSEGQMGVTTALSEIEKSKIQPGELEWAINLVRDGAVEAGQAGLDEVRQNCLARGWLRN